MHIENYEWTLYLHGGLSRQRMKEIEEHMSCCDRCLDAYVAAAAGTEPTPAAQRRPLMSVLNRSVRFSAIAALVFLIFIGISFTPQGKTAWANMIMSMEKLSEALSSYFRMETNPEWIETFDLPAVTDQGIEIKIDQMFLDDSNIFVSLLLISDWDDDVEHLYIPNSELVTSGHKMYLSSVPFPDAKASKVEDEQGNSKTVFPVVLMSETHEDLTKNSHLDFHLEIKSIILNQEHLNPISGNWAFDFSVNGTQLARATRTISLSHQFYDDDKQYKMEELVISPIRTRVQFQRMNPLQSGTWVDENGVSHAAYATLINVHGFLVSDEQGNEVEIAYDESPPMFQDELRFIYYCRPEDNPYSWLKDAKWVEITPYVSSLTYESNLPGLKKYMPLDDATLRVDLTKGK